jgi:hypothetical protein
MQVEKKFSIHACHATEFYERFGTLHIGDLLRMIHDV